MIRSLPQLAGALLLLGTTASAQSTLTPRKITAPIKDRGTYHLATGTWSRANPADSFNARVLFNNTAPSGYFFGTSGAFDTVDHGRIPSTSSPTSPTSVTGIGDVYSIFCFQIGYCSNIPASAGGVDFNLTFYDNYGPCTDISAPAVAANAVAGFSATGLAGGTPGSTQGCWISSFDLSNTTVTFALRGDADGSWDNQSNIDSFGWALQFPFGISGAAGNGTGPFISGNCPSGGIAGNPTTPQQGFQTTFGGTTGATDSTGLGTSDFFWIDAVGLVANANGGCFFFGNMGNGCTDPSIVGPGKNPYGSYWLQLFGYSSIDSIPTTKYCGTTVNGTGAAAVLTLWGTDVHSDLVFTSTPVPNTTGQFFYGPMMLNLAGGLGDGFRCVGGMTTRMLPFVSSGMMMSPPNTAIFTVNYTAPYASGFTGVKNFQHWFRDPAAVTGSNTSDAVSIQF